MSESILRLDDHELCALIHRVFRPTLEDRRIAILIDLPDRRTPDQPTWLKRRQLAHDWAERLAAMAGEVGRTTDLYLYCNVGANNADLPATAWHHSGGALPTTADRLDPAAAEPLSAIFEGHSILIALTQFSATAPLKLAAPQHGFRAATMPRFSAAMIPALRLDYREIDRRVWALKKLLDPATSAEIRFSVKGEPMRLDLDLRHRLAHASGGLLTTPGTAGNLPSGEAYIAPYEGERRGDKSRSQGLMPVEFGGEVVCYRVVENSAIEVVSKGPESYRQMEMLAREPAYGNLAEFGLGVLADLGVRPIGVTLLDEKLGLHIAFGRSDHFGGQVGPSHFSSPSAVVHIDHVYLPETQPQVRVEAVDLVFADRDTQPLIRDHRFTLWNPSAASDESKIGRAI